VYYLFDFIFTFNLNFNIQSIRKQTKTMAKKEKTKTTKSEEDQQLINNPNDKFFKFLFSMVVVVKGYFQDLFPKYLSEKLNLNTLELDNTTYITAELGAFYSDIVWQCQLVGSSKIVHVCFIFEHKSYVPDYPHVQIGDYKQGAYNKQLAAGQPLKVVIPIIVYHGKQKWEEKPFHTYFGDVDPAFQHFIDLNAYYLTNLQDYSDEMIEAFSVVFLRKAFLALKHYTEKKYLKAHFLELIFIGHEENNSKETLDFVKSFYVYLSNKLGGITEKEVKILIEKFDNQSKKETMYNFIEEIEQKGEKRGEILGEIRGKKIAIYEAYQRSQDIALLCRLFDMPEIKILDIIEEMKKREQLKNKN
jgi:predicted transposase/invertase (TIGR01784 family)